MKTFGNVLWLVLSGLWLWLAYAFAGVLMCCTVIGIPFGVQAFKLGNYALWPFGRALVRRDDRDAGVAAAGSVLWFIFVGWWLVLVHLVAALLWAVTIIGIPFAVANMKLAGTALAPFGKRIVKASELALLPPSPDTVVVGAA